MEEVCGVLGYIDMAVVSRHKDDVLAELDFILRDAVTFNDYHY